MKRSVFLAALYVFFLTFSLLSLFFGETGVTALDKIRARNQLLSGNLSVLDSKQEDLLSRLTALRSDPESIVVEARALGLYRGSDQVVQFRNMESIHDLPDAGGVLHLLPMARTDESLLRVFATASAVIFLLFSLIVWKLKDAVKA